MLLSGRATPHFVYQWVNSYQVKLNRTQTTLSFNKTDLTDLAALETLLPHTRARHLLLIPSTSAHLIARYLTGVGNIDDVLFASQFWKKAGMNLTLYSSGDVDIYGQLSGYSPSADVFLRPSSREGWHGKSYFYRPLESGEHSFNCILSLA